MVLKVYNTLGRRKDEFVPLVSEKVSIYVCGPTVYDYIHIGNARAFIVADVVRRYLEYKGYKVNLVSNITDIDDKILQRARKTGLSVQQLGEKYIEAYLDDIMKLNIKSPNVKPRATKHIPEMIETIETLIEKGYAYQAEGNVYFEISKFKEYGKLSGNLAKALQIGSRIEVDPKKRNPADFVLWKAEKPGEIGWHSPWGKGRPGWHIECSTMAAKYVGETFDIHMGGKDLIFPHHENEIAQAEATTGKLFAKYWLHNEWLTVNGKKMSKSLGNFVTVRDAIGNYSPQSLRFFLTSSHYRSPIDFNERALKNAEKHMNRIKSAFTRIEEIAEKSQNSLKDEDLLSEVLKSKGRFDNAMDDDFNTPLAITALFDIARAINSYADYNSEIDIATKSKVLGTFEQLLEVLGIGNNIIEKMKASHEIVNSLLSLILDLRQNMRTRKDWENSDLIRKRLHKIGITIEDAKDGSKWKIKRVHTR